MSRADDYPVQVLFIKPHEKHWRELMLDLGAPLDAKWEIWVTVYTRRISDDMPYDISEQVSIQDRSLWKSGESIGETEVSDSDLALFNPIYVMRTRFFLVDDPPIPEEVSPVSPIFPEMPFIEIRTHRIEASPSAYPIVNFQIGSVPIEKQADELLRLLHWWKVYVVNRRINKRHGWPIEQIHRWTNEAIEKMAQKSKADGKIISYSFIRFHKAFPRKFARTHLYHLITKDELAALKSRYLKRCAQLIDKKS